MPIVRLLLLGLLGCAPHVLAAERLSLRLSGGYTEFNGVVNHDATISPVIHNPFDPDETLELPPAATRVPAAYESNDESWEATLSYRLWRNLQLFGGYVDLGEFASEPHLVGGFAVIITPPPGGNPSFRLRPPFGDPIFGPGPIAQPPLQPIRSQVVLDANAWLLGARVEHAVTDRMDVYLRGAALRASFDLDSSYPAFLDVHEPPSRTGWAWGVGAEYEIFPRVSAGNAFNQYDVKLQKLDSYQLTLAFDLL